MVLDLGPAGASRVSCGTVGMRRRCSNRRKASVAREIGQGTGKAAYAYILIVSGLTACLGVAAPTMAMPVLFSEIAGDLGLTLVQVGAVWGTVSFAGLFTSLLGGVIGDRFGTKRTLTVACFLLGLTGASRGLSTGLASMTATVFLTGLLTAAIPMNLHKTCAAWFSGKRLGSANAVISGCMALGFMLGSLISASVLSPGLGGWRNVLFFYGAIGLLLTLPWALAPISPREREARQAGRPAMPIRQGLSHVIRLPDVWILGIALLGVGGGIQGLLGYLPLYLREIGWAGATADASLASFHAISLVMVFPLAMLSDRIGSRRRLLAAATLLIAIGVGLLSIADGIVIWVAVLMAGAVRDGYMAVFMTSVTEAPGVGVEFAGTAIGLAMMLSRIGSLIAPPLGNSLAVHGPRVPFLLWAGMALVGLAALGLLRWRGARSSPSAVSARWVEGD